jgi:hypothetical protein
MTKSGEAVVLPAMPSSILYTDIAPGTELCVFKAPTPLFWASSPPNRRIARME